MASIRKKGDHQWHAQVRRKGHPPQTKTFTTRADAERWAKIVESEIERGVFVSRSESEATLLRDMLKRYEVEVLPSKRGRDADRSRLKTLQAALGNFRLAGLSSTHVSKFRDARLESVGPQSVIHEINLLNRVLKAATLDWGIALPGGLPTAQVRKPAKPRGRDRRVSVQELHSILQSTESGELRAVVVLAIETAMRRGELASLRWKHIDLEKRTAHLPKTKTEVPRDVPLSTAALAALKGLPRRLDGKVFGLQPESMSQAFERACEPHRANVPDLHKEAKQVMLPFPTGSRRTRDLSGLSAAIVIASFTTAAVPTTQASSAKRAACAGIGSRFSSLMVFPLPDHFKRLSTRIEDSGPSLA